MLVRYKKSCEKIAMGLLSFMPQEKNLTNLRHSMLRYEKNPSWQLYLLKVNESYVGLIGIEVEEDYFIVHHVSVLPSHRGEGYGLMMVDKLQQMMLKKEMKTTEETDEFLAKCRSKIAHSGITGLAHTGLNHSYK